MKKIFYFWMALVAISVVMGSCKDKNKPAVLSVIPKIMKFDGSKDDYANVTLEASHEWHVEESPEWTIVVPNECAVPNDVMAIQVNCMKGEPAEGIVVFKMEELRDTLHVIRK